MWAGGDLWYAYFFLNFNINHENMTGTGIQKVFGVNFLRKNSNKKSKHIFKASGAQCMQCGGRGVSVKIMLPHSDRGLAIAYLWS